jgi:hypothetical protein
MTADVNAEPEPKLAPPGAGLPKPELFIERLLFALRRVTSSREAVNERFQRERAHIRRLIQALNDEESARRVLIKRPPGLEDSSRFWSVWMTLDHLRIVNKSMSRVIKVLTNGVVPGGEASTAALKPRMDVTGAITAAHEASCDQLLATAAAAGDLKTSLKYRHPWFGPLNAAGWHAVAAGHMHVHRVQIERICEGLGHVS